MSIKLTGAQLTLLSAASKPVDPYLMLPEGPRNASAKKAVAKLLEKGLVRQVRARKDAPVWRRDKDADLAFAVKLTAVGVKALAANLPGDGERDEPTTEGDAACEAPKAKRPVARPDGSLNEQQQPSSPRAPRADTKIGAAIGMLGREIGATVGELSAAMGWLPHTTRAALTGLRKRGYALASDRSDRGRGTAYRIGGQETGAGSDPVRVGDKSPRTNGQATPEAAIDTPVPQEPPHDSTPEKRARRRGGRLAA